MEEKKCNTNTIIGQFENIIHSGSVLNKERVEVMKLTRRSSEVQTISNENYDNVSKTFNVELRRTRSSDLNFLANDLEKADGELSSGKSESCCVIM